MNLWELASGPIIPVSPLPPPPTYLRDKFCLSGRKKKKKKKKKKRGRREFAILLPG